MATFEQGLEFAAREIEQADCGLFGKELLARLAAKVRSLRPPENGKSVTVISGVDAAFECFKEEYPRGPRNHWAPAKKAFETAVKKRHHDPRVIIEGTMAFAASGKEFQFIEAPAVFLNQDRFLTTYNPPPPPTNGASGLFAVESALRL